jgi:zinc transport system substrate-binding protein
VHALRVNVSVAPQETVRAYIAVCSGLSRATIAQYGGCGAGTGLAWYTHGHTGLVGGRVRRLRQYPLAMLLAIICLSPGWSVWGEAGTPATPRLKVAVTIFPLYDLVRNIAGPAVETVLLVPPAASPHTFEAKPGVIRALTGSSVLFAIGHGLDDWAIRLAQEAGVGRTVVVDDQIPLRPATHAEHNHGAPHSPQHSPGAIDPHYWLTIPNAMRMVQTLTKVLGELAPAAQQDYEARAKAYQEQLRSVDSDIRSLFAALPRRHFATFHQAFDYFAAEYNLQVVATFEPSPGQEPPPRHVEAFLRQVRAYKLRVVFVEPQLPQGALASLARDLKIRLQELDPEGGRPGRDSYIALMRFNATQIAASLRE